MAPSSILSIIHTVTIGTMLNFNGGNKGHGLKNVTCKQTLNRIQMVYLCQKNLGNKVVENVPGGMRVKAQPPPPAPVSLECSPNWWLISLIRSSEA